MCIVAAKGAKGKHQNLVVSLLFLAPSPKFDKMIFLLFPLRFPLALWLLLVGMYEKPFCPGIGANFSTRLPLDAAGHFRFAEKRRTTVKN